jgi:hypothetical protein
MRLRSPKDNEKGYETTQHMVRANPILAPVSGES